MWLWTSLILGIAGSVHCAGMCGPIALMFSAVNENKVGATIAYNLGRATTYSIFGLLSGLAGAAIFIGGGQQVLSIVGGCFILLMILLAYVNVPILKKLQEPFRKFVREKLSVLMKKRSKTSSFLIGVVNGLLPCGLVYAALGGAAVAGGPLEGGAFMAVFGLGTFPMMAFLSLAGGKMSPVLHRKLNKLIPYTFALVAVLLLLRGANLGIPYLSPKVEKQEMACCHRVH